MFTSFNNVSLRDFIISDINSKIQWINDPDNNKFLHYDIPLEYNKTRQWYIKKDNKIRLDCVIEYKQLPVGVIGLLAIDTVNLKAEYYITLGNTAFKRRGIATIATFLIIEYAFIELKLNKVYLNVDADNLGACRLYEKVGFLCEGLFQQDLMRNNEYIDRKRYAILQRNWDYEWRKKFIH